jgi:hypothetical protein
MYCLFNFIRRGSDDISSNDRVIGENHFDMEWSSCYLIWDNISAFFWWDWAGGEHKVTG